MNNINTIIFDIGNVLAEFRWKDYLDDCGYEEEVKSKIAKATVQNKLWKEWDRGSIDETKLIDLFCQEEPSLSKEIQKFMEDKLHLVREYEYAEGLVKDLRKNGYKVYLLSNYSKSHFTQCKEFFKFLPHVDGGVISYELNYVKPEPQIYEALISKYNINPSQAVFLDDLQENLEGAKPFGFYTIQVRSYEEMIQELQGLGVNI